MLPPVELTPEQYERLKIARTTKKFGHLCTWKELFIFQYTIATKKQVIEIGKYARKRNEIKLPLMKYLSEQKEFI